MYNTVFFFLLAFVLLDYLFSQGVGYLNYTTFGKPIPPELSDVYDEQRYRLQQEYNRECYRFGCWRGGFSTLVTVLVLCFGVLGWLDGVLRTCTENPVWLALLFFGVWCFFNECLDLPFDWYSTFHIEAKYDFNRSTHQLFVQDTLKSWGLSIVMGGLLLGLMVWIYTLTPIYFWLWAWAVVSAFSIFMQLFYSNLIVPLFNRQTPLEPGELRTAIEQFAGRVGFQLNNIYVMDSSKRSTRANAYFTGLGSKKRIVLYDTLIKQLTTEEIVAVLGHEIGHYKHKHTLVSLLLSLVMNLLMFFLLGVFLRSPALSIALGGTVPCFHLGMVAFIMLYTPVSLCLGLALNALSRRHEYQADAFVGNFGLGEGLISGLKKISGQALSNLHPHPVYVFVHFSHPTLLQRIHALRA